MVAGRRWWWRRPATSTTIQGDVVSDLHVARQSGQVMLDGRRHAIRRGVTVAEEGSDMLAKHGKLFEPMRVHYPAPTRRGRREAAVEQATAAPGELRTVPPPPPESPPPAEYACDECPATAKSPAGLAAHKRSHRGDDQ
jgi:hypothetical protein